jgi:hypothetical protein
MTAEELNDHVKSGSTFGLTRGPAPHITCADGWTVSIQASTYHYCSPRDDFGPYTSFELGFPSALEPELAPYAEDPDTTKTVFARVPLETVLMLINRHGGVK